ncbi:hypothetical protein MJ390_21075 [Klebsiella pneumoniae]|nr:hypothetical protein MJ390_21075 [Klebsiella pneumoniae]
MPGLLEQRGHRQGLKQGLEQGLQQGIEQGIEQGEQQTAERYRPGDALANGLDLSLVAAKMTGLAPECLARLQRGLFPYPPAPRRSCGASSLFSSMCRR